ncbi:MAG: AMP-binding protein [Myxococcota bacterium]
MRKHVAGLSIPALTDADLPLQSVYRHARERPDAPFLFQPHSGGQVDVYTWKRTLDEVRHLAGYLGKFPRGTKIAMVSKNCAQHFIFDLAIWMSGHISVAIYPTVMDDTLKYVLEHSEAKLLLVGKLDDWNSMSNGVPESMEMVTCDLSPNVPGATRWDQLMASEPVSGEPVRSLDETLMIMYTSGSTGTPKGAEVTTGQSASWAHAAIKTLGTGSSDRSMSYLPLAHAFERNGILMASFMSGMQVHFVESLETFVEDVKRAKPTMFHSVPRLWLKFKAGVEAKMPAKKLQRYLKIPLFGSVVRKKVLTGLGLDQCRMAFTGSAPIPADVLKWYAELGLDLLEGYGMTENNILCTMNRPGKGRPGYVGEPLPTVEIRISDEGEIQTKSPGLMTGYYKDEAKTAEAFTDDGWLRTGDRGEISDDGLVKITGRVKELFKTQKGKYIAPAPIENILNATDLVEQSCVMGVGLPQPFAIVMLNEIAREKFNAGETAPIVAELERVLVETNSELGGHEKLSNLVVTGLEWSIANAMLTPTMKIKRSAIEERYASYAAEGGLKKTGIVIDEETTAAAVA